MTREVRNRDYRRIEPRGLSRSEAAAYVGVSPSLFDQMVKDGRMPQAKKVNARVIWGRHQLDEAFKALPDGADNDRNLWDDEVAA